MEGVRVDKHIEIEDIEWMRRSVGINDVELWGAIRALHTGDYVRLTFVGSAGSQAVETLRVRITRIRGNEFRGKLVDSPTFRGLSTLHAGSAIAFSRSHIHSVAARPRSNRQGSQSQSVRRLVSRK
jgi:hypothetical protein